MQRQTLDNVSVALEEFQLVTTRARELNTDSVTVNFQQLARHFHPLLRVKLQLPLSGTRAVVIDALLDQEAGQVSEDSRWVGSTEELSLPDLAIRFESQHFKLFLFETNV